MRISQIQKDLKQALGASLKAIAYENPPDKPLDYPDIEIEIPKNEKHGDLSTNIAMRLARQLQTSGVKLAGLVKEKIVTYIGSGLLREVISKVEVYPPGFVNFHFSKSYLDSVMTLVQKDGRDFGRGRDGCGQRVDLEFVSANPTGPLTIAHGRQAAVGDAIARILEFSGYRVTREYLINDMGTQIDILAKSIQSRYLSINGIDVPFPSDGYQGEYIKDIARELNNTFGKRFISQDPGDLKVIAGFGVEFMLRGIRSDLDKFGVHFDKWFSQSALSREKVEAVLKDLRSNGFIYEKDGATWFRSSVFGDDKDRVVIKKDGALTYLAPDIAYHLDKYKRGFDKIVDIWGPDHHGYISRLKASIQALGYDKASISVLIVQLATLYRSGEVISMSTRKGEFITLSEVVGEVGRDVAKFFFLMRKLDSHLDFDLEVAKKSSLDNPVYYIQYAHARIASILKFSDNMEKRLAEIKYDPGLIGQPEELLILRMICQFPLAVQASAKLLEPYRMVEYLSELAKIFHSFYTKHRVVLEDDLPSTKARLTLVRCVKAVLANGLGLLGISLPDRM
ncbi:MAG: arginine--tRNA ligase [Candidatus Omnitrophota bacterium]